MAFPQPDNNLTPPTASALLAAIVDSAADAIISKTLDGIIMSWNRAAERIFGYTAEEMVGRPVLVLIPPENRDEEPAILARIRRGEKVEPYETVRQRKDGSRVDVSLAISPVRDVTGKVIGASKIARDISDRKRADYHQRLLAAIVESSDDAIISKDLDGIVTSWNTGAERMFGFSAVEAVGRPISLIIPPERMGDETIILTQIRAGVRVDHFESVRRTKTGQLVPVSITVSPIKDASGEIIGAAKIARDISAQKAAREEIVRINASLEDKVKVRTAELTAINQELEAFTYSVAHDLRAPLRALHGYLDMVQAELGSAPKGVLGHLAQSDRCVARMDHLIEDILRLSRVGRQELKCRAVSLNELVKDAQLELLPEAQQREIDWRVDLLPTVRCDPGLTRQVFTNLLSNALKYTRSRPQAVIEIRAIDIRGKNAILVRDNGIGFDMQYAGKLFLPFERLHPQSKFEGSGVGLAIAERIIRKHGGEIWATGKEDAGAAFYFTLEQTSSAARSSFEVSECV